VTAQAIVQARKSPKAAAATMNAAMVQGVKEVVQAQLDLDSSVKRRRIRRRP